MIRVERVVVTGSREFRDAERIEADLRALLPLGLRRVAQGGNGINTQLASEMPPKSIQSADALAWLATLHLDLEDATYHVDKGQDGKWPVCGPRRNRRMLKAERPALVLAYPSTASKGTWSCIEEAFRLGIPTAVWVGWAEGAAAADAVNSAVAARNTGWNGRLRMTYSSGHRVFIGDHDMADALLEVFPS